MSLKLAIGTPVVTMDPVSHAPWEETASIEDLTRIAEAADRLGYHHLTCSEHVALPAAELTRRAISVLGPTGYFRLPRRSYQPDPLYHPRRWFLAYHHPLDIAKRYGTLDKVSNGRLILGVGVGTLKEEFDLIGAPFDQRGARGDDALRALRASLSQPAARISR